MGNTKLSLNIPERIALLNVLPPEGNVVTLRLVRELQNKLSFSEDEIEEFRIKNTVIDGRASTTWDENFSDKEKVIVLGDATQGIIEKRLKMLDGQNRLHISMLPLYEKVVEGKGIEKT